MPKTSSIGFTVVKKTACLPLLRLVPRIDPFLTTGFNSFAFRAWLRYSVNPFGKSILSCYADFVTLSPECP